MPLAADGDLLLLHRFQQGRLRFRRRAVDLVGQHNVGEQRPGQKTERTRTRLFVFLNNLRARDVGRHQVGRELHAVELERQRIGKRANHQRLGQPGHAHQQAMPAGEKGDEQLLDHFLLPDDALGDFVGDAAIGFAQALNGLKILSIWHDDSILICKRLVSRPT